MTLNPLTRNLREGSLPHFFCPGCGAAQVLNYFLRAADAVGLDFGRLVGIGGVGCTARIPVYLKADCLHGVHGRTLPWATGVKLHNPALKVVIFSGDGDAAAIGGNHLIQAARRNLDVTMIVVNNLNYGMTGGQVAPTTPEGANTMTTPYGNVEPRFDLCALAATAGATYVSRWNTFRSRQGIRAIEGALRHRGFSLVEFVAQCPTNYGRRALGSGDAAKNIRWIEEHSVTAEQAKLLSADDLGTRFVLGDFVNTSRPVFAGSSTMPQGGES
ncbi:MAG: thiamine pyrophosphate-dependent enzyme [Thermotogota bacterium]